MSKPLSPLLRKVKKLRAAGTTTDRHSYITLSTLQSDDQRTEGQYISTKLGIAPGVLHLSS